MNEPIRVLHVLGKLHRGGAETMIMNLYRKIDRTKVQFDFVVHNDEVEAYEAEIIELGGMIHRVPKYTGLNHLKYVDSWKKLISNHQEYQIIHGHVRSTAAIYLKICKEYQRKTISHSHNISSGKGISALVKNIYQYPIKYIADYFLAPSTLAGEWLFGKEILSKPNFHILRNSIDTSEFKYNEALRSQFRKSLNITNELVLGHVGRFHSQKNHMFLIDVFNQVQKKYNNSKLLLIGSGSEYDKVIQKSKDLGLENEIIHIETTPDIPGFMQAMDVFVFPSHYEGLGIVAIESQAAGLPTLVSENIPNEAFLTDLIKKESLSNGSTVWADRLLNITKNHKREDRTEIIKASGYDIVENAIWLEEFYLSIKKIRDYKF